VFQTEPNLSSLGIPYSPDEFIRRIKADDMQAVRLLLDAGMNPNLKAGLIVPEIPGASQATLASLAREAREDEGDSALGIAAKYGSTESAKLLISAGADVNFHKQDQYAETPVTYARRSGHHGLAELLREVGGNGYWVFTMPGLGEDVLVPDNFSLQEVEQMKQSTLNDYSGITSETFDEAWSARR